MASPTTPDEFEQHQALDGALVDDSVVPADESDRPLTPDELEQRQEVGDDDRDEFPGGDGDEGGDLDGE